MFSADWFFELMGFREDGYETTRRRLAVEGDELISTGNGKRYGIGELALPTLAELRLKVNPSTGRRLVLQHAVPDDQVRNETAKRKAV